MAKKSDFKNQLVQVITSWESIEEAVMLERGRLGMTLQRDFRRQRM
jgi:hypothetical protein